MSDNKYLIGQKVKYDDGVGWIYDIKRWADGGYYYLISEQSYYEEIPKSIVIKYEKIDESDIKEVIT